MNNRALVMCTSAIVLLVSIAPAAQTRPDFSGTWVMDAPRSESAHQAESSGPVTLVIAQTADDIRIHTSQGTLKQELVYRFDGSKTTTRVGDATATASMQWDGDKLVTETIYDIRGYPVTSLQVRSLNAAGEMEVVNTLRVEHGYQWTGTNRVLSAPHYATGKDVFVRSR